MKHLLVRLALYQLKSQKNWRKSENWQKRSKIIDKLGQLKHPFAVDSLLEVIKQDDIGHFARHAIIALGDIGDNRVVDELLTMLWDHFGEVPLALGKIGDPKAIKPILEMITDNRWSNWPFSSRSVQALTLFVNEEVVEPLIDFATNSEYSSLAIQGLENNLKMIPYKISNEKLQRIIDLENIVQKIGRAASRERV